MEILSSTGTQFRDFHMTQGRHDADIGRFQEVLNRAVEEQQANGLRPGEEGGVTDRAAIREAAEMFESYFIQMMFREMRRSSETLNEDSFIPRSQAERIFTEMLDERTAKDAAANGGIGLADMIYSQMTRHLN
ncbi:MAG: rod-binding protein [Defluviitaleaceae bacterium]|nr:rod-binding protein [Defluviitaleaceae bacterium]MCL2273565.1 rod-binding protein [Defluviitaleaceae bacterium]